MRFCERSRHSTMRIHQNIEITDNSTRSSGFGGSLARHNGNFMDNQRWREYFGPVRNTRENVHLINIVARQTQCTHTVVHAILTPFVRIGGAPRTRVHIHGRSMYTNCRIHRKTRAFRDATELPERLGKGSVRNFR